MPNSTKNATPTGPCPNPECPVKETKSAGVMTPATKGMPRINMAKQGCSRCLQPARQRQRNTKFHWTPATLAVAVNIGMKKLDGVRLTRADTDFSSALAADDAAALAEAESLKVAA